MRRPVAKHAIFRTPRHSISDTTLHRLGEWCFEKRRTVVLAWVGAVIAIFAIGGIVGSGFDATTRIPDSESARGSDVIEEYFGGVGAGLSGSIVFTSERTIDDPAVREAMEAWFEEIAEIEDVAVSSPYAGPGSGGVTDDRTIAFASLDFHPDVTDEESPSIGEEIRELEPDVAGLRIEYGGRALVEFEPPESELIGIAFAIVVLILAFGSVLAMGLPISVALFGVASGVGGVILLSNITGGPTFVTTLAVMIGLGVGIDYALFIVTRFREGVRIGMGPAEATAAALDTSGRAVLFAGMTVVISLLGLIIIGLPFITAIGVSMSTTVLTTMLASVTLLPAILGFAHHRVEVTRWRGLVAAALLAVGLLAIGLKLHPVLYAVPLALSAIVLVAGSAVGALRAEVRRKPPKPVPETVAYRLSRIVQARPWTIAIGGTALLLVISVPLLDLRLGFADEGNFAPETTTRQAYDLLAEGFGRGFNGPLILTAETSGPAQVDEVDRLVDALASTPGVDRVFDPVTASAASPPIYLIRLIPSSAPQDEMTENLVHDLRENVIPAAVAGTGIDVNVTGVVAAGIDFSDYLASRTIVFFAAVLTLSFLLLTMVFRSLLIPLKAVIMNLLSISAAYGVMVALFQWGWLDQITGIETAPVESWMPMMLFAIVFGLSMDYEVFLLARVKEEFDRSGDSSESVANGLASTARVISAAAAIMVVVFGSFVLEDNRQIQMFGTGLAAAIALDATIVRMLLVPATMELLGSRNWWIPGWLDRLLPQIAVEGGRHESATSAGPAASETVS
jgi:RND superfamily putative drug exporter